MIPAFILILLISVLETAEASSTCLFINQDTSSVLVVTADSNAAAATTGGTQSITIDEGDTISISCVNADQQEFQYNTAMSYTCPVGGMSQSQDLPLCVDKCNNLVTIDDPNSVFVVVTASGAVTTVTNTALAALSPVTIQCTAPYSQQFGKSSSQTCEEWSADALCMRMCELSSYDKKSTVVDGKVVSSGGVEYLKVGNSITIRCSDDGYGLPAGADNTALCTQNNNHDVINIQSCKEVCRVPKNAPTNTVYVANQDKLKAGESFAVSCTGSYKLPFYASDTVVCQDDGNFGEIPQCKETCSVSAAGDTVQLNTTVIGNLAEDQAVEVSCVDDTRLLPYGTPTPWIMVCRDQENFVIPACQQTCSVPATPPNAELERVPTAGTVNLSLREPILAKCKDYYSYESGTEVAEFECLESESGIAEVDIDTFCYVYAKLSHQSAGTYKLSLTGEIADGKDHSSDGTSITLQITGARTDITKTGILPNIAVEVDVGVYEPLSVAVTTTSVVDGVTRVVTRTYDNIYPGPPSPKMEQTSSTSDSVVVKLTNSGDALFDSISSDQLIKHKISYSNKGSTVSIDVTDSTQPVPLPNLVPASTYLVSITTTLTPLYGGVGSPSTYTFYTGPSRVSDLTFTIKQTDVQISWSEVPDASSYEVAVYEGNNQLVSKTTSGFTVPLINIDPGKTFRVTIATERFVLLDGNNERYMGGEYSEDMDSAPLSPQASLFTVTNTSTDVTISRVSQNNKRDVESTEYVVFMNGAQYPFPADVPALTLPDLALSTVYTVEIAQAVGSDGYGMKTTLTTITTADCGSLDCNNCANGTEALFAYVKENTLVSFECMEGYTTAQRNEEGEITQVAGMSLFCNNKNQYIVPDRDLIFKGPVECIKQEAVVVTSKDYTLYYYIGAGVVGFLIIITIILILVLRSRRVRGTYNAKKVNENSLNGTMSPTQTPRSYVHENAYFENKMDLELMRNHSVRSKATSYGSQELRMEIADSDSGITEDVADTYFNPSAFSNSKYDDDTISTKSALV